MKIHVNGTGHDLFPFASYDREKRTHRSAAEEWQPHQTQGDRSAEWWNLTAVVFDPAGARYFLSWTVTHPGRVQIKPGYSLYAGRLTLISYQASIRKAGSPWMFVMNDREVWDKARARGDARGTSTSAPGPLTASGWTWRCGRRRLGFSLKVLAGSQACGPRPQLNYPSRAAPADHGLGHLTRTSEGSPSTSTSAVLAWADRPPRRQALVPGDTSCCLAVYAAAALAPCCWRASLPPCYPPG